MAVGGEPVGVGVLVAGLAADAEGAVATEANNTVTNISKQVANKIDFRKEWGLGFMVVFLS